MFMNNRTRGVRCGVPEGYGTVYPSGTIIISMF